ncbi:PqqD family peptide modification chaperone [Chloroflexota bacterium]
MNPIYPLSIYKLYPNILLECFDDGALLMKMEDGQLVELDPVASDMIESSDGFNNVNDIAALISSKYHITLKEAEQDVINLYEQLTAKKIMFELDPHLQKGNKNMTDNTNSTFIYLCNPDVVLREEDEDGGLLFNPDTSQVKVVNTTGLYIWKQFAHANEISQVIKAMMSEIEDVPQDEVLKDVQDFLDEMLQTGFIGTVEPE